MTGKEELLSEKDRLWIRMRLRLKGVRMDKLLPPKAEGGGLLSAREPNELRDALGGSEELKSAILFVMEKLKKRVYKPITELFWIVILQNTPETGELIWI